MFSVNSNMRRHFRTHASPDGADDGGGGEGGAGANAYPRGDDSESEDWSSDER